MTLSQRGLMLRLNIDVSTIRRRGEFVVGYAGDKGILWKETWRKVLYPNGRLMHYQRVKTEGPND